MRRRSSHMRSNSRNRDPGPGRPRHLTNPATLLHLWCRRRPVQGWVSFSLVDRYFFPIKACPEPLVLRAALSTGCGLDLCSDGDGTIAFGTGCPGNQCKFTSACADDSVLRRLSEAGVRLEADSLEQALRWRACGGTTCGLRVRGARPNALYGPKFGLQLHEVAWTAYRLADAGLQLEGLHLHDQHSNLTPCEFAARLAETFGLAGSEILGRCRYVNIGGSWPMRHGKPTSVQDLRAALHGLRGQLSELGFRGVLHAEPGQWVVGNCGYWAARGRHKGPSTGRRTSRRGAGHQRTRALPPFSIALCGAPGRHSPPGSPHHYLRYLRLR